MKSMPHLEKVNNFNLDCNDVITFCLKNDIQFLSEVSFTKADDVLGRWIAETGEEIISNLIPKTFWDKHSLMKPTIPSTLNPTENESGLPIFLLVMWSCLSETIRKIIVKCLIAGLTRWEISDTCSHYDWIQTYTRCISNYLNYIVSEMKSQDTSHSKFTEAIFFLPVIKATSQFFGIVTNHDIAKSVVTKFFEVLDNTSPELVCDDLNDVPEEHKLSVFPNNLDMVSILDFFKKTHFIKASRQFYKFDPFTKLANVIHTLLQKKDLSNDSYTKAIEEAAEEALYILDICDADDHPHAKITSIVFVKLISDFIMYSKSKVVTDKEIVVMKILCPAYSSVSNEDDISKLKRLLTAQDPPLLPFDFMVDMIESRFTKKSSEWFHYFGDQFTVKDHSRKKPQSCKTDENAHVTIKDKVVSTVYGMGKSNVKAASSKSKVFVGKKRKTNDKLVASHKSRRMGTRANPNPVIKITKLVKEAEETLKKGKSLKAVPKNSYAKTGICSYPGCSDKNGTLKKCFNCKEFKVHVSCHEKFFASKKLKKDDEENTIKYCWFCSRHTPGATIAKKSKLSPRRISKRVH